MIGRYLACLSIALPAIAHAQAAPPAAVAQPEGITRTNLLRNDLGAAGREAIQVRVDFASGAEFPGHSHPGEELVYVLSGALEYRLAGSPPVTLKTGEILFIPAGAVHSVRNAGSGNASELATYIVEKGKPLLVLAE